MGAVAGPGGPDYAGKLSRFQRRLAANGDYAAADYAGDAHAAADGDNKVYVRLSNHSNTDAQPVEPGRFVTIRQGSRGGCLD